MHIKILICMSLVYSIIVTSCISSATNTQPSQIESNTTIIIDDLVIMDKSLQETCEEGTVLIEPAPTITNIRIVHPARTKKILPKDHVKKE